MRSAVPRSASPSLAPGAIEPYRAWVTAKEWIVDRAALPHTVQQHTRIAAIDGRITAVDQLAPGPGAIRLHGTLLPGFVDLQVNGAGGRSVDQATPDALDTVAAAVADGGAAAFLPTLITAPWDQLLEQVAAVARWIRRWNGEGAEPLGLHLEGPFLIAPGAHDARHFVDPTPARIEALLTAANGTLKLLTIANARPGAATAIEHLQRHGVTCSLGHCDRTTGFAECVHAGARAVTHLFNVMGPLHHRDVGLASLALDEALLVCSMILDGVHVHPTMVRNAFRMLGADRLVLVTDAVAAAGMPDGEYHLSGARVFAEAGVVRDGEGRLAGSALTMAQCARNFLQFVPEAGPWTLARIASTNPARMLSGVERYGSLAIGSRAAFSLLGDDGAVTRVR